MLIDLGSARRPSCRRGCGGPVAVRVSLPRMCVSPSDRSAAAPQRLDWRGFGHRDAMRAEAVATAGKLPDEAGDGPAAAPRAGEERLRVALAAGRMGVVVVGPRDRAAGVGRHRLPAVRPRARGRGDARRLHQDRAPGRPRLPRGRLRPGAGRARDGGRVRVPGGGGGEVRWLASRAETIVGPDGRATGRVGVNWDITEKKRAEDAFRARDELLDLAERSAGIGVGTTTSRPRRSGARRSSSGCSGWSRPQGGCRSSGFARPATRRTAGGWEALALALAEGAERYETECRVTGSGGETR